MATVVYGPNMTQELGLLMNLYDMIQNRRMVNAYKEDVTKTLGERQTGREFETTQQQKQTQINTPTGWTYEPQDKGFRYVDGKMVPFTEGAGDFVPTGFETQTTEVPIDVQRQRSPEELKSYDIQTRRMLDTLGAGVPPSVRADTRAFTMWPEEGGLEEYMSKQEAKRFAPKSVQAYVSNEPTPKLYNLNDPNEYSNAQQAIKKGYKLEKISPDQLAQLQSLYGKEKYTGEPETVSAIEKKIEEKTLSPEERKQKQLQPVMKYFDNLSIGKTDEQKAIINQYKEKAMSASPEKYGTLVRDAVSDIKKSMQKGKVATENVIQSYIQLYGKDKALEKLKKDGYQ